MDVLSGSPHLTAIGQTLVAQPPIPAATVYATLDMKPRALSNAEFTELFEPVLELNHPMTQPRPSIQPLPAMVSSRDVEARVRPGDLPGAVRPSAASPGSPR